MQRYKISSSHGAQCKFTLDAPVSPPTTASTLRLNQSIAQDPTHKLPSLLPRPLPGSCCDPPLSHHYLASFSAHLWPHRLPTALSTLRGGSRLFIVLMHVLNVQSTSSDWNIFSLYINYKLLLKFVLVTDRTYYYQFTKTNDVLITRFCWLYIFFSIEFQSFCLHCVTFHPINGIT